MLAEAGVELKTQGLKELLDGLKGVATAMIEVQKAVDIMQAAFSKAKDAVQPFGTQTQQSMNQAQAAMKNVDSAVKNMATSVTQGVNSANTVIKTLFNNTENDSKHSSDKVHRHWNNLFSLNRLSNATALGMAKFETLKQAGLAVFSGGKKVVDSGKEFDTAANEIRASVQTPEMANSIIKELENIIQKNSYSGQSIKQIGEALLHLHKEFKGYEKPEELKELFKEFLLASKVHGSAVDSLYDTLYASAKKIHPTSKSDQIKQMSKNLKSMAAGVMHGTNAKDYEDQLSSIGLAADLAKANNWDYDRLVAMANKFGSESLILIKRIQESKSVAKAFAKTLPAKLRSEGKSGEGVFFDDDVLKAMKERAESAPKDQKQYYSDVLRSAEKQNEKQIEAAAETLKAQIAADPAAILRILPNLRSRLKTHYKEKMKDADKAEAAASSELQKDTGMNSIRMMRHFLGPMNAMTNAGADEIDKIQKQMKTTTESPITPDARIWDQQKESLSEIIDTLKLELERMERSLLNVGKGSLSRILLDLTNDFSTSSDKIGLMAESLSVKLEAMVKGFKSAFSEGGDVGNSSIVVSILKHLDSMKDKDFSEFGKHVGETFKKIGYTAEALGKALYLAAQGFNALYKAAAWMFESKMDTSGFDDLMAKVNSETKARLEKEKAEAAGIYSTRQDDLKAVASGAPIAKTPPGYVRNEQMYLNIPAEPPRIDVNVKVYTQDGKEVPSNSETEIMSDNPEVTYPGANRMWPGLKSVGSR